MCIRSPLKVLADILFLHLLSISQVSAVCRPFCCIYTLLLGSFEGRREQKDERNCLGNSLNHALKATLLFISHHPRWCHRAGWMGIRGCHETCRHHNEALLLLQDAISRMDWRMLPYKAVDSTVNEGL